MDRSEPGPADGDSPALDAARPDRFVRAVVGLALVLGLLRFVRLGTWSLWIDESLTWADAFHGIDGGENYNPLGYRLIAATVQVFGGTPTEWSLRILPAVAGWLCIPATFLAFRGLFGGRRAAAASLLVAVSSWHVYWSQNARFYTFAQLAMLVGAGILCSAFARARTSDSRLLSLRAVLGLGVAASAALFHASALLVLPALCLGPLVLQRAGRPLEDTPRARRVARDLALVAVLGGLAAMPWVWKAWSTYAEQKGQAASLGAVLSSMAHFVKTTGFFVTPLLGAALLAGTYFAARSRGGVGAFAVLAVFSALGFALGASALARVSAQYVFVVLPWIALVAVLPIGNAAPGPFGRRGELAWMFVLVLPALATCGLYMTTRSGERPMYREAYQFAANVRAPDEQIFGTSVTVGEFYLAPTNTNLRHPTALSSLDYYSAQARVPQEWARRGQRALYVLNPEEFADWDARDAADFQRFLREECRLVAAWPLYVESRDLSVWVYRRD
jgi:hypothetical protein